MKKTNILLIAITFLAFFPLITKSQSKNDAQAALRGITAKLEQSNSISINIIYKCKLLYSQKTETIKAKVEMIRSNTDANFGCIFWYKVADSVEKYYDGKTIYMINHNSKKIITQDATGDLDLITQDLDGDLIRIPFVVPKSLTGLINNENKLKLTINKKIPNSQILNVKYPNEKNVSDAEMDLVFNKKTFELFKIFSKMKFKDQFQSNEWNFSDIQYGNITESALKSRFEKMKKMYKTEKFQKPQHQFQGK